MLNEIKSPPPKADSSGKTKLLVFLFLAGSIIPNLLFAPKGLAQWTQQGPKLVGTGAVGNAYQGGSVAISSDGNTAIEGGPYDNNNGTGAAWVFTRSGGVWIQQGPKLVGTGAVGSPWQGHSVAISSDGNTAILGGPYDNNNSGAVWVFTRSGGVWTQQGPKLVGTGAVGGAFQGWSAAISSDGNTAIVGGPSDSGSAGAVWIFTRSAGVWTQQGPKLVGTGAIANPFVDQGYSVAISSDGNTAIEGGSHDGYYSGAVWVFTRSGGVWTQQGSKLVGTGAVGVAYQGWSAAISPNGNTVIEGGNYDNNFTGAVWVFTRSGGVWTQQGSKLVGTGGVGSYFSQGWSVAISSDGTAIEGGPDDSNGAGAVWVFYNATVGITPISGEVPKTFSLMQNYPNPFNPTTNIGFRIAKFGFVKITVFDVLGREVAILVNEQLHPGTYKADWNASNQPSGVYFYRLEARDYSETKKMMIVK
jgi:hypothetical protein